MPQGTLLPCAKSKRANCKNAFLDQSTMKQAADAFIRYGFRALPVTDANGNILGVVPHRDVMDLKHHILD